MSAPASRSRWMKWDPKSRILADSPESAPTKPAQVPSTLANSPEGLPTEPTKAHSVGFEGATPVECPKIQAPEPDQLALAHASGVLAAAGVRLMELGGTTTIGLSSDLDGPEIRAALEVFGSGLLPVRSLDG